MLARISAIPLLLFGFATTVSVVGGNVASGLILLTALAIFLSHHLRPNHLPPREIMLALLALIGTHALSTAVLAPGPVHWDKIYEEMWFKLLLVTVPVVAAGRSRLIITSVFLVILAGVVSGIYAGYQNATGNDLFREAKLHSIVGNFIATGFHSHHLSFGGQIMLSLVVAMAWLRDVLLNNPRRLWLPLLACLILGMGLVWSFARSSQVGAFAAALLFVTTLPHKWRRAGIGMLVVLVIFAVAMPQVRDRVVEGFTDEKEVTRVNLWRSSIAGIADRPLSGWGQGNFGKMLEKHEVPGYYEARSHSHNDYLMYAVSAGIPGLLAALWLIWATIKYLNSGWRRMGSGSWVVLAALGCQVSIGIAGLFQVYQTDDNPEMLFYFLIGCGLAMLSCDVPVTEDI